MVRPFSQRLAISQWHLLNVHLGQRWPLCLSITSWSPQQNTGNQHLGHLSKKHSDWSVLKSSYVQATVNRTNVLSHGYNQQTTQLYVNLGFTLTCSLKFNIDPWPSYLWVMWSIAGVLTGFCPQDPPECNKNFQGPPTEAFIAVLFGQRFEIKHNFSIILYASTCSYWEVLFFSTLQTIIYSVIYQYIQFIDCSIYYQLSKCCSCCIIILAYYTLSYNAECNHK